MNKSPFEHNNHMAIREKKKDKLRESCNIDYNLEKVVVRDYI